MHVKYVRTATKVHRGVDMLHCNTCGAVYVRVLAVPVRVRRTVYLI